MNKTIHPIEPEELMAYLDGELSTDREAAAVEHLNQCAECQEVVASLRGVSQSLKIWKVEPSEQVISPALAEALDDFKPEPRTVVGSQRRNWGKVLGQRWGAFAWVGGLAAIAGVFYLGTVSFKDRKMLPSFYEVESRQVERSASPAAAPVQDKQFARLEQFSKPNTPKSAESAGVLREGQAPTNVPTVSGPMIIRNAQLALITKDFDKARAAIETTLKRHRGYVGQLKVGGSTGSGRTLSGTLRVPSDQLDATLAELKALGRVESESQSGQDVTSEYVDLQARLANARNTEQRLTDILRERTGKLSDVLEVEQEVDRVRGEIEQMEAERKNMSNQVSFATLNATITEDYKAQLQVVPPSTSTRLSNAAVEGYRSVVDGVLSLVLFLLSNGPSLLLWAAILFLPARYAWKKVRRGFAQ